MGTGTSEERVRALEAEVRHLRQMLESTPDFIARVTTSGQFLYLNRLAPGFQMQQVLGTSVEAYMPPEFAERTQAALRAARETRSVQEYATAGQISADRVGQYLTRVSPVIEDGEVTSLVVIATDVTALQEQRILLQVALDATRLGFWTFKPTENLGTWDARMHDIFGLPEAEPAPPTEVFLERHVFAEDRQRVVETLATSHDSGRFGPVEYRIVRPGGEVRWISACGLAVKNPLGEPVLLVGSVQDVTERRTLEARLLEAQKLESIGYLAGGVAHDFNNMLTAILGNIDFAARAGSLDEVTPHLAEIRVCAERSAALTAQLLAFARRQMIAPKVLDPNALIERVERLVRRLLGEQIRVTLRLGAQGLVRADESQLEQVIMNLVTNARDALVKGGTLHLETSDERLERGAAAQTPDIAPGCYVTISVMDDGPGIPAESLPHIFEPFYTTRARGTGLGLATCYGIVKQSGGHIVVSSQPGKGTTFRVYLPSVDTTLSSVPQPPTAAAVHAGERVLLVEDEPSVRAMVERSLRRHGYVVHSAATAEDALELAAAEAPFALLVTDVVLPGMNGRDLSCRLAEHSPELRVLFISGYTQNTIERDGVLDSGIDFLQKPFLPAQLAAAVRTVLASPKELKPGAR
jgi:PAS domain S-box-containing protein